MAIEHFEPVQLFFHLPKGVIANLVVGTQGSDTLSRGIQGFLETLAPRR